jgi:3-dehydroquinate synthetase
MLLDMREEEERGSQIRSRLTFGYTIATALYDLAQGDLTFEEALSCGMIWEARMGLRAGRVPLRLYQDLEGVIAYHGLPSHYDIPRENIEAYFLTRFSPDDIITLHLPKKKGTLAPYSLSLENFLAQLAQGQN